MMPIAVGSNTLIGQSGTSYRHDVYYLEHVENIDVSGVYVIYRDKAPAIEQHTFDPIYVGKAEDETIAARFSGGHDHQDCFSENGAKFIGVIVPARNTSITDVESDLIKALKPVCNVQQINGAD